MAINTVKPGAMLHGFEVASVTDIPEYRAKGIRLRHVATGCDVFHLLNDDEENLFAFAFKTLPPDSKGAAHIVEHSVLCGSQRFPLKEPFILLVQGSPNTFLNAFTFPDKTVYPAASTVEKDLFNLMQVYGDAVFFPLLRRELFGQEGSRLQFDANGNLEVTGVVYNEMKGNYSSHDSIVGEWSYRTLFPDTPYFHDSGGDPKMIRDLSYEEFKEFHRVYYHPSNTRVFLYGNIPTEKYLAVLNDQFLSKFEKLDVDFSIPTQPRWSKPVEFTTTYPIDPKESTGGKTTVTVSWLLPKVTDPETLISFEMLSEILLGSSGAPLEKALIESGLGEDLSPATGLETEFMEMVFGAGLIGSDLDKKEAIETLVISTLERIAKEGFEPDLIEGALRRVEFRNREIKGSPFGLRLMRRALRGWLHDASPVATLEFTPWLSRLRRHLEENPRYFEDLISSGLLSNPHRATVVVMPDTGQQAREAEETRKWLDGRERTLSETDKAALREEQERLAKFQETPDAPEEVAKVPFLKISDLPREVEVIPSKPGGMLAGVPLVTHEFFTNGVVYLDISIDVSSLPESLSAALPLYAQAFRECGLPGVTYDELSNRISLVLGGLGAGVEANLVAGRDGGGDPVAANTVKQHVVIRMKVLEDRIEPGLDLLRDILLTPDFANLRRIRDLFLELRNDFKSSLIPGGSSFVALRTERAFSRAEAIEETWRGVTQHLRLAGLSADDDIAGIAQSLTDLRGTLIKRSRFTINITCAPEFMDTARNRVEQFLSAFPPGTPGDVRTGLPDLPELRQFESLIVPSSVGFVAASIPASQMGDPGHAHEVVLAHLLRTGYLWEQIRMKGGAYGASASANGFGRMFTFASYRDPNILSTLQAYQASLENFARTAPDARSLELGVLGTVGRDLRPLSPGEKGLVGFKRVMYGISDESRQLKRDQILATNTSDIRAAAERLRVAMAGGVFSIMAGRDAVRKAAQTNPALESNTIDIPM